MANLDKSQKKYAKKLFDQLEAILGKKDIKDLDKDELKTVIALGEKFKDLVIHKKMQTGGITEIAGKTPEGKEVWFDLDEQLEEWRSFYQKHGIDWCELPDEISVTEEEEQEMQRLIEELGFDHMLIIPENLADTGEKYRQLHEKMSEGYNKFFESDWFKEDGSFEGLRNKSNGLRIILCKNIQELDEDELHESTLNKSVDDLEAEDGIFAQNGVRGMDSAIYLVLQRKYYEQTGQHLDSKKWIWLTEHERPASGRVPYASWDHVHSRLHFCSLQSAHRDTFLGCRLAGSFEK